MMRASQLWMFALGATSALADLNCLTWGIPSTHQQVVCHPISLPGNLTEIENRTQSLVNRWTKLAGRVKDLVKADAYFNYEHMPLKMEWDVSKTDRAGLISINTTTQDLSWASGAVDGSKTPAVGSIIHPALFGDYAVCTLSQAIEIMNATTQGSALPAADQDLDSITKCASDYLERHRISPASIFKATDEAVKNTTDTAGFFALFWVSNDSEAETERLKTIDEVATGGGRPRVQEGGVHLELQNGDPEGINLRIYQKSSDGEAQLFPSADVAYTVQNSLVANSTFRSKSCGYCAAPESVQQRRGLAQGNALIRRGLLDFFCCAAPAVNEQPSGGESATPPPQPPNALQDDPDTPQGAQWASVNAEASAYSADTSTGNSLVQVAANLLEQAEKFKKKPMDVYDTARYKLVQEKDLVDPPIKYTIRPWEDPNSVSELGLDLKTINTGAIGWSKELRAQIDPGGANAGSESDMMLSVFREIFEGWHPDVYDFMKGEHIEKAADGGRWSSNSDNWLHKKPGVAMTDEGRDLALRAQEFAKQALQDAYKLVAQLKGWSDETLKSLLDHEYLSGNMWFFWNEPSQRALLGTDDRGLHSDDDIMTFIVSDQTGLIVQNELMRTDPEFKGYTYSRVPTLKNAFYCVKGDFWAPFKRDVTRHTVFGADMAKTGRLSMVMSVDWQKGFREAEEDASMQNLSFEEWYKKYPNGMEDTDEDDLLANAVADMEDKDPPN